MGFHCSQCADSWGLRVVDTMKMCVHVEMVSTIARSFLRR